MKNRKRADDGLQHDAIMCTMARTYSMDCASHASLSAKAAANISLLDEVDVMATESYRLINAISSSTLKTLATHRRSELIRY